MLFSKMLTLNMVDQALNGGYFHAGQVCSAGSRIIVHNDIKDEFETAFINQ